MAAQQSWIRNRFQRWVHRRIPRADVQTFSQKTIFILPTGAGVVFGLLLLVMLVTGINYQNSLIYLLTFMLGALFVGAMHQTHRNLAGLTVTLVRAGEGTAGDDIPFRFRLTAGKDDSLSVHLSVEDSDLGPIHVLAGESQNVTLPVPSAHRGYLRPDRIRIETRYPFGLLKAWSWLRPLASGVAWPRPVPAPDSQSTVEDDSDTDRARRKTGQDEADLRPWREGDLSPRVMWKRFARSGQMIVADWEAQQGSPYWLDFAAFPGADTELRLSYLAWQVAERSAKGERFGLSLPGESIEPDSGPVHAQRCLGALAVYGEEKPRIAEPRVFGSRATMDPA